MSLKGAKPTLSMRSRNVPAGSGSENAPSLLDCVCCRNGGHSTNHCRARYPRALRVGDDPGEDAGRAARRNRTGASRGGVLACARLGRRVEALSPEW